MPRHQAPNLNSNLANSLNLTFAPSDAEVCGMVQDILRVKQWSPSYFAAVLGVSGTLMRDLRDNWNPKINAPLRRLVWMFWTLDNNFEVLLNPALIASWGKTRAETPVFQMPATPISRREAVEELERMNAAPQTEHLTPLEVARKFGIGIPMAEEYARLAQYKLSGSKRDAASELAHWLKYKVPWYMKPKSDWLNMDWRQNDETIACQTGKGVRYVYKVRLAVKKFLTNYKRDWARLKKITAINPDHYSPLRKKGRTCHTKSLPSGSGDAQVVDANNGEETNIPEHQ